MIYAWSLSTGVQEVGAVKTWMTEANKTAVKKVTLLPTSGDRLNGSLSGMKPKEDLVIVAHGEPKTIGTAGESVTYSVNDLATQLVTTMGLTNDVRVVIAACDTDQFAADLQAAIRKSANHGSVVCIGQKGPFTFTSNFVPPARS